MLWFSFSHHESAGTHKLLPSPCRFLPAQTTEMIPVMPYTGSLRTYRHLSSGCTHREGAGNKQMRSKFSLWNNRKSHSCYLNHNSLTNSLAVHYSYAQQRETTWHGASGDDCQVLRTQLSLLSTLNISWFTKVVFFLRLVIQRFLRHLWATTALSQWRFILHEFQCFPNTYLTKHPWPAQRSSEFVMQVELRLKQGVK